METEVDEAEEKEVAAKTEKSRLEEVQSELLGEEAAYESGGHFKCKCLNGEQSTLMEVTTPHAPNEAGQVVEVVGQAIST